MKSIICNEKRCYLCGSTSRLEEHHIYFGNPLRKISEKHGFKVWLCAYHHRDNKHGVHGCRELDLMLKRKCQEEYEKNHSREEFIRLVGKNYL